MKKLALTTKLILLMAFPLAGVAGFGIFIAAEKWAVVRNYKKLQTSAVVLGQIGNVVHELQKERGRSAVFAGSGGVKFAAELPAQQQATDAALLKLRILLSQFDAAGFGTEFESVFGRGLAAVNELPNKRASIQNLTLSSAESTAYFTATIASLAEVLVAMSHHVDDIEIANGMACYVNFIQTKEQTGIERALLSGCFNADKFTGDSFSRFSKAVAAQETYQHVFESFATDEQKRFFDDTVRGAAVETAAAMRRTAIEKATTGGFGINPAAWFDAITARMDLMKTVEDRLAADYNASAQRVCRTAQRSFVTCAAITTAILIFTAALGAWVVRSITGPLKRVIVDLTSGAEQTASASGQISSSSQQLAEHASEQAASLEQTGASLEEVSSMIQRNAKDARAAKDLANQTRLAAETGAGDMRAMSDAVAKIKTASNNISKILKTIDEIAFQTNILALNAAVEAARAGESGLGFAVVADEVRSLAQRSAQAARETALSIEDSIGKSNYGVEISRKVEQSLQEIVTKACQMDEQVAQIASASSEQGQAISQVSVAVNQMDKVTQANAASAEESAAAAEELNAQTAMLKDAVNELRKLVGQSVDAPATFRSMDFSTQLSGKSQRSDRNPARLELVGADEPWKPAPAFGLRDTNRQDACAAKPS